MITIRYKHLIFLYTVKNQNFNELMLLKKAWQNDEVTFGNFVTL